MECRDFVLSMLNEAHKMPYFVSILLNSVASCNIKTQKSRVRNLAFLLVLVLGALPVFSATVTSTGTGGDWYTASTWAGGVVPDSTDDIVIASGATVTISADAVCLSLLLNNSSTLTVNTSSSLRVKSSTGIYVSNAANSNLSCAINGAGSVSCDYLSVGGGVALGTDSTTYTTSLNCGVASLNITNDLTISSTYDTTSKVNNAKFNLETGSVTINGSLVTINSNDVNISTFSMATGSQNGKLNFAGASPVFLSGTGSTNLQFNGASSTVSYTDAADQTVQSTTYTNLTLSGSGVKTTSSVTVNGVLLMQGSATCSGSAITYGASSTIEYAGSTAQTTGTEFPSTFNGSGGVIINNSDGVTLDGAKTIGYSLDIVAGTLDLNGHNVTAGDLQGSGNVTCLASPNASLTVGGDNASTTFSGQIQDGSQVVSVIKNGTGAWTLTGASTFTGGMTLNTGTLNINNAQALGDVTSTFAINGGSIDNTTVGSITTINYPQTWGGDFTFIGTQNLNLGTGAVAMSADRDVTTLASTLTIGGVISGSALTLAKDGAGAMALGGTNTYTGGTILNAGELDINNAQALGSVTGSFTINGGIIDNTTGSSITTINYPQVWNADFTFTGTQNLNLGTGIITIKADVQITTTANTLTEAGNISTSSFSVTKAGTGTLSFASNTVSLKNLTINDGTLVSTSANLNLVGNFANNATFTHNSGTAVFKGSSAQSIGGSSSTSFNNLTMNGAGEKTLSAPVSVAGNLTLTNGLLTTDATNILSITATGSTSGANDNSFVNGPVVKTGNSAFVFPVGKAGTGYQAVGMSAPGNATDAFTAEYMRADPHTLGSTVSGDLNKISHCEYWLLERTAGTSSVDVSLYGNANSGCNSTTGANYFTGIDTSLSDLKVAHFNTGTSTWEDVGGTTTGTSPDITTTATGVSSFSPFTFGSNGDNALPITLISFTASALNNNTLLKWSTANEINNNHFDIERSDDEFNFTKIAEVKGAGNSSTTKNYSYTDISAATTASPVLYYRLKQVDNNGTFTYTNIADVSFSAQSGDITQVDIMPNPFTRTFVVNYTLPVNQTVNISVYDAQGRRISYREISAQKGLNDAAFDLAQYAKGLYFVQLSYGGAVANYRMVKE